MGLPPGEGGHGRLLVLRFHPAVDQPHPQVGEHLLLQPFCVLHHPLQIGGGTLRVGLDGRADDVGLPPLADLLADEAVHPLPFGFPHQHRFHRKAARRKLVDDRHVQVPVDDKG